MSREPGARARAREELQDRLDRAVDQYAREIVTLTAEQRLTTDQADRLIDRLRHSHQDLLSAIWGDAC